MFRLALALGKSVREVAQFPAWEIQAWMAYYSIEPWDLANTAIKSFLSDGKALPAAKPADSDAAVLRWAGTHNARLQAKKKG